MPDNTHRRELLKDPPMLNLICGAGTIYTGYNLVLAGHPAPGHIAAVWLFGSGFVVSVFAAGPPKYDGLTTLGYIFLTMGSFALLIAISVNFL